MESVVLFCPLLSPVFPTRAPPLVQFSPLPVAVWAAFPVVALVPAPVKFGPALGTRSISDGRDTIDGDDNINSKLREPEGNSSIGGAYSPGLMKCLLTNQYIDIEKAEISCYFYESKFESKLVE